MRFEQWLLTIPLRLRSIFRREEVERELDEELQYHIERQIQEYLESGMSPEQARRAALLAMGGVERRKEECRDTRRVLLIERLAQDLLYNIRIFRREPGFTIVAILSLSFVIGANTAIFQLINAIQLKHLPIPNPQELVEVKIAGGSPSFGMFSSWGGETTNPLWEQIRERQGALSEIFAWGGDKIIIGRGADARSVNMIWVSGEFFPALGLHPEFGRLFNSDDDRRGCKSGGVVISHAFWRDYFRGEGSAVGKTLILGDKPFTVIGVTTSDFHGLEVGAGFDVALPLSARAVWDNALDTQDHYWLVVMGRLKPDWSMEDAARHLSAISPGIFEATASPVYDPVPYLRDIYMKLRLTIAPAGHGISPLRSNYKATLWLLLGVSGLVLLIACVNLANLMLARARAREREFAVRAALGASQIRLFWQIFLGSLLLVTAGTLVGGFLAQLLSRGLASLITAGSHTYQLNLVWDWRVLSFTVLVALLSTIMFGLAPSLWVSAVGLGDIVKSGWLGLKRNRRFLLQRGLLVAQIAASLTLLVNSPLYVQSFGNLARKDIGFSKNGILIATYISNHYGLENKGIKPFEKLLLEQVRSIPHVDSAATTTSVPLGGDVYYLGINIPGGSAQQKMALSYFTYVSPQYFRTIGIPILAGRDFTDLDTSTSQKVAIVNESFVHRFLADMNPVGATVNVLDILNTPETPHQVIGIVKDTSCCSLREAIPPVAYVPATQDPEPMPFVKIVARSSAPASDITEEAKRRLEKLNPDISVRFENFETKINNRLIRERLVAWLTSLYGITAFVLVSIGLFGMTSYVVLSRKHEIGIRLALGANRIDMVRMILREMAVIFLTGAGAGAIISLVAIKYSADLLFEISPQYIYVALFISACLLAVVIYIASYIPIFRASCINPMMVLKDE